MSYYLFISVVEPVPPASSANEHCFAMTQDDFLNEHVLVVMLYAKDREQNYFSMLESFLSANGSVKVSPCCISVKSSLFLDASPRPSVGSPFLKYLSTGAFF